MTPPCLFFYEISENVTRQRRRVLLSIDAQFVSYMRPSDYKELLLKQRVRGHPPLGLGLNYRPVGNERPHRTMPKRLEDE